MKKTLSFMKYVLAGLFFFLIFLISDLPQVRIKNYLVNTARESLQYQGLSISMSELEVSLLPTPHLSANNIRIYSIDQDQQQAVIEKIQISPLWTSLLLLRPAAHILTEGALESDFSIIKTSSAGGFSLDGSFQHLDLKAFSLIQKYIPIRFSSGILQGRFSYNISPNSQPQGSSDLSLTNLKSLETTISGINVPPLQISSGDVNASLLGQQITVKSFHLGKDLKKDDIVGSAQGDLQLAGSLNLTIKMNVSPSITASLGSVLDLVLSQARKPDGQYQFRISGPSYSPQITPL